MAEEQTVVDHLLLGRRAMQDEVVRLDAEVRRLSTAIEQLDSVIGMLHSTSAAGAPAESRVAPLSRGEASVTVPAPRYTAPERSAPVAAGAAGAASGVDTTAPAKKAPARARKPRGQAPKSIRVHVLEMLAAENREWSLSEIIDRIHGAGIQAHDDAVRSITIKLMKDGRVERVGRGQYRLARRGGSRQASTSAAGDLPAPAAEALAEPVVDVTVDTVADVPVEPPAETSPTVRTVDVAGTEAAGAGQVPATTSWSDTTAYESGASTVEDEASAVEVADEAAQDAAQDDTSATSSPDTGAPEQPKPYTPPLNLGQPWG